MGWGDKESEKVLVLWHEKIFREKVSVPRDFGYRKASVPNGSIGITELEHLIVF